MKLLGELIWTFFKVGISTFGGGYAMLPVIQREIVEKKHWATEEEVLDYYAIGQCTPGIIALNTSTFIGYRYMGVIGAAACSLGFILPSWVIITLIAALLSNFADIPAVQHALGGIRACVCVLIANAVAKLYKKSVVDRETLLLFLIVLLIMIGFKYGLGISVSPVLFVILSGAAGIFLQVKKGGRA